MKKFITTTFILAAGTMLSHAAITVISTTFSTTGTSSSDVSLTAQSDSLSRTLTGTLSSLKKSADVTSTDYTTDLDVRNLNLSGLPNSFAPDVNVATAGQWQAVFTYSGWSSAWTFDSVDLSTFGFTNANEWQNSGSGTSTNGDTSSTTTPDNNSSGKYVGFTVEYSLVDKSSNSTSAAWTSLGSYSIDVSKTDGGGRGEFRSHDDFFRERSDSSERKPRFAHSRFDESRFRGRDFCRIVCD